MQRRNTRAFLTGRLPLPTATQPAAARPERSLSSSPSRPRVMAPIGRTLTGERFAATSRIRLVTAPESLTGDVSGDAHRVVNPPCAAAMLSEAMLPFCPLPGSRRLQHRSTKPGLIRQPLTSRVFGSSLAAPGDSRAAIRPSRMTTVLASPVVAKRPPIRVRFDGDWEWVRLTMTPFLPVDYDRPSVRPWPWTSPPFGWRCRWSPGPESPTGARRPPPIRSPRPG